MTAPYYRPFAGFGYFAPEMRKPTLCGENATA